MAEEFDIDALIADAAQASSVAIGPFIQEVARKAFAAGQAAERQRVVDMINGGGARPVAQAEPRPAFVPEPPPAEPAAEAPRRAPRGLTKSVTDFVLEQFSGGLPLDELQEQVVTMDHRVSPKTVYNELMRGRGKDYRYSLGRWYKIGAASDVRSAPPELDEEARTLLS